MVLGRERLEGDRIDDAAKVFEQVCLEADFPTFLTIPAYAQIPVENKET